MFRQCSMHRGSKTINRIISNRVGVGTRSQQRCLILFMYLLVSCSLDRSSCHWVKPSRWILSSLLILWDLITMLDVATTQGAPGQSVEDYMSSRDKVPDWINSEIIMFTPKKNGYHVPKWASRLLKVAKSIKSRRSQVSSTLAIMLLYCIFICNIVYLFKHS